MSNSSAAVAQPFAAQLNASAMCAHCDGPAPIPVQQHGRAFCCPGCATTFETLHALGLGGFYKLRAESRAQGRKVSELSLDLSLFDTAAFWGAHVRALSETESQVCLLLSGVHCVGCVWVLEQLPKLMPGVVRSELSFSDGVLRVDFQKSQVQLSKLGNLLSQLGYSPRPFTPAERVSREQAEEKDFLLRLGVAGFGFGNNMVIATSLYQGYFTGIDADIRTFMHWVSMLIAFPVVLYSGTPFFRSFFTSVVTRRLHMDVPIAVGILVILGYSMWNTFIGAERVYFDSVCALVFLLLLGRFFQQRSLARARRAAEEQIELLPIQATVLRDSAEALVPQWDIRASDIVLVAAGSRVPVDGVICSGTSSFNTAVMTGESAPQTLTEGDSVYGGYLNLESEIRVQPSGTPDATRLSKLLQLLDSGAMQKTPLVESAERILAWFVVAVLTLAVLTFFLWIPSGFQHALDATVSLLVICCPCALALATPLALATGVRRAAAAGILIRRADVLERAARIKKIFFDKTGTVTLGELAVREATFISEPLRDEARSVASELALAGRAHPASKAVLAYFGEAASRLAFREEPQWVTGCGVRAIDQLGREWRLGSESFALTKHAVVSSPGALTVLHLSLSGEQVASFSLSDAINPLAPATLSFLRQGGTELALLSGDHPATVRAIGKDLGFGAEQCFGGQSPEEKQAMVKACGAGCMMVGDGINDAGALGAADVGVAVKGDALRCLESSDVALVDRGIEAVPELLQGSRRVIRVVRENLLISLLYNVVGAALAIAGKVDPLLAALIMPLSSLTVLANSHFRKTFASIMR